MDIIQILQKYDNNKLEGFPRVIYSSLFKRVLNSFHFEFQVGDENLLYSPLYTLLHGEMNTDLDELVSRNELFLDSLKEFIVSSLFVYSAIVEENSYYLVKSQCVMIARLISRANEELEIKFYAHYQDELLDSYADKIYIGRMFLDLQKFSKDDLGLGFNFKSLKEQNKKIQERAKNKLRYFEDYKKSDLNEIEYMIDETVEDAAERIEMIRSTDFRSASMIKLDEILENLLYMQNLLIELKDFTLEFENKLRMREEGNFAKYLTKFTKDLKNDLRYLRKISAYAQLKVSKYIFF